ncbi:MAG: hypothetical protein KDA92_24740 [Planctomycetales bacterium]|nr:hypothetical protein [Planctomycetales bacterium]
MRIFVCRPDPCRTPSRRRMT